jgi:hypothetical protein
MADALLPEDKRVPPFEQLGKLMLRAAAIRRGKLVFSLPRPARHHDIIQAIVAAGVPAPIGSAQGFIQGFIDLNCDFKDRAEAAYLVGKTDPPRLYSEDLW